MHSAFDNSSRRRRLFTLRSPEETADDPIPPSEAPVPPAVKPSLKHLREPDVPRSMLSRFRRACGQKTAFIVKISSSESGARPQPVLWNRPCLIIGKGEDCDLQLNHTEVSRRHAYFQIINERIYCADLGSRTGTHWPNGASQAGWVNTDESVSIGPYSLTFEPAPQLFDAERAEDEFSRDDLLTTPDSEENFNCFLDFLNAGQNVRRYRVARDVTLIGSGDAAKVHLAHPSVSKTHCSIVRTPSGLWLVDLLSDDGTIINGHIEPLAPLNSGDEFQVGRFLVSVHCGDEEDDGASTQFSVTSDERSPDPTRPNSGIVNSAATSDSLSNSSSSASPAETNLSALNQLAHLTSGMPTQTGSGGGVGGLSEQFVLNIIKELGVMQQQALQHAQESMKQTVNTLAMTYQDRIDALERQHAALRDQLLGLSSQQPNSLGLPDPNSGIWSDQPPWDGPDMADTEFSHLPEPGHGSYDCSDPEEREAWIRERMRAVETELDKTRRGWGKKLIEMLGY
ncbi:MAG: FHA domain-containing protein [Planctomycetaceae bacterium]|nr:FHA domain-containing protein [Planctomycetaceae bacterium]